MTSLTTRQGSPVRRCPRPFIAVGVLACCICNKGLAQAGEPSEPSVEPNACLSWDISAGRRCPKAAEIEAAVEAVLARPVFGDARCDIGVEGSIRPRKTGGWVAALSFTRPDGSSLGTRYLESRSPQCASLQGPISLAVALMVEATETRTTVSAEPLQPKPASEGAHALRRLRTLSAELSAAWGLLPGAAIGASVTGGTRLWGPFLGRVSGGVWAPRESDASDHGGRFWGWHLGPGLCLDLSSSAGGRGTWICGGAQLGMIHGQGKGLDDNVSVRRPYGHAEVSLGTAWPLGRGLALTARAGLAVPWVRPRFVYRGLAGVASEVHRPEVVVPLAGLGLEWSKVGAGPSISEEP